MCTAIHESKSDASFDVNFDGEINHIDLETLLRVDFGSRSGDVNLDGRFDTRDLVQVFQTGLYEKDSSSSAWSHGDWNCDGRFDSSDLVTAMQSGYDDLQAAIAAWPMMKLLGRMRNGKCELLSLLRSMNHHRLVLLIT